MPASRERRPTVSIKDAAAGRRSLLTVAVTTDPVAQPPRKLKKKTVDRVGKALRKAARAAAGAGLVVEVDLGALTAAAGRATAPEPRPSTHSVREPAAAAPAAQAGEAAKKQARRTRPGGTAAAVRTPASGGPAAGNGAGGEDRHDGEPSGPTAKAPRAPGQSRPALRRTPARPPQP